MTAPSTAHLTLGDLRSAGCVQARFAGCAAPGKVAGFLLARGLWDQFEVLEGASPARAFSPEGLPRSLDTWQAE
jgi:hypothetical protein